MLKKIGCILLTAAMVLSLAACGKGPEAGRTVKGGQSSGVAAGPAQVTEPITVELWHTFGSGEQAAYMQQAIETFNSTNRHGITVVGNYIGGYVALRTSLSIAIGAGENPQMAVLGMSPILASNGVLADMAPYAERDGFDVNNIFDEMKGTMYYDDALVSLPFLRSSIVYVYNEDMWKAAGYNAPPSTVAEMVQQCSTVASRNGVLGFGMLIDPSYYQEALIQSLGGEGIVDRSTTSASCLDDGTMLQMLTDWKSWVDAGWCYRPSVTNSATEMQQMLYTGQLASGLYSSGVLSALMNYSKEAGIKLNATLMPGYNGPHAVSGGGDISIIAANNNEQQVAACWEFIKFLFEDEQVVRRHIDTGYLPTTHTSIESQTLQNFWEENPAFRVVYEHRENSADPVGSIYRSEWNTQVSQAISYVIQDGSKTPEEAVGYLKQMYSTVFPK